MSHNTFPQRIETPTTKPQQPTIDPPTLALPPSLPKQTYFDHDLDLSANDMGTGRRGSAWEQQPSVARSLTNNDHSIIPQSIGAGGGSGIKMGQSPTILSILSGSDQTTTGMSFRTGSSMVASSRTYATTTVPQQQFSPQHQQPQIHNNLIGQYPPPQPMHNHQDEEDDDDLSDMDEIEQQDLQFDFME